MAIAKKFPNLIKRLGRSKNHTVKLKFKTNFKPIHQRGRRIPIDLQSQFEEELKKLQKSGNVVKMDKCSEKNFFAYSNYSQTGQNNKTCYGL